MQAKLPMGIENFREMRTGGFYYVDKTGLIKTLLENPGKVNLFTRPRRFGKTLNMSMLKYFFEAGSDVMLFDNGTLFEELEISKEKELCEEYMGKFPVISITLKGATGESFEDAKVMLRRIIGKEAMRFRFLLESDRIDDAERSQYKALVSMDKTGAFTMSDELFLVADAVLGRDALGEIDLRTGDRGPGFEVIVAAGREEPRHDGNSRQNEYLQTFHMPFYFTDLYV